MRAIITFCNKTHGSYWWLFIAIIFATIPSAIIITTLLFFANTEILFVKKVFTVLLFQKELAVWLLSMTIPLCIYSMLFSATFFRVWRCHIFLFDPSYQFHGWDVQILQFNGEQERYFFEYLPI